MYMYKSSYLRIFSSVNSTFSLLFLEFECERQKTLKLTFARYFIIDEKAFAEDVKT